MKADFSFYAMNNYPLKLTANWSKDGCDLLFTASGQDPETCYFYYIPKAGLLSLSGSAHWILILSEKEWFTEELRVSVIKLIGKAANGLA